MSLFDEYPDRPPFGPPYRPWVDNTADSPYVCEAAVSHDGVYRYELLRRWNKALPILAFIMLNPSTADGRDDDPTIRKCVTFAHGFGYGTLLVGNVFAVRDTDPDHLLPRQAAGQDIVGPENDGVLLGMVAIADAIVLAYGGHAATRKNPARVKAVHALVARADKPVYALALTDRGEPRHPLYLPGASPLLPFDVKNNL